MVTLYSHKVCVRNILMKGPLQSPNDNPYSFINLKHKKGTLSGIASPYRPSKGVSPLPPSRGVKGMECGARKWEKMVGDWGGGGKGMPSRKIPIYWFCVCWQMQNSNWLILTLGHMKIEDVPLWTLLRQRLHERFLFIASMYSPYIIRLLKQLLSSVCS